MLDNVKEAPGNWFSRSRRFLSEVRNEMGRVTWPARKEVYATTVVVILVSTFFGLYLWGVDMVFNTFIGWIFSRFGAG
jgi:preprotein translocase subunit SecE